MKKRKFLDDGSVETYVYFMCDKIGCGKQNYRRIFYFDRTILNKACPIKNIDDTCTYCHKDIHEPIYVIVDPYNKNS